MATINSIYYNSPGKQLFIDNNTNQFVISGYRLALDPNLNRDLLLVQAPDTTGDIGVKGNIAFDEHHIYYCINQNNWVRGRLASWSAESDAFGQGFIPPPVNWWKFTFDANATVGSYNFQRANASPSSLNPFDLVEGYRNNLSEFVPQGQLLNYSSNLIELSNKNEDFTLIFEVRRVVPFSFASNLLMGSLYGKLGFHFSFVNRSISKTSKGLHETPGSNLQFALSAHTPTTENWVSAVTSTTISTSNYMQVVAINNAATKEIKIYVDGTLQGTQSYSSITLGSKFNNPIHQGFCIGGSPKGSQAGSRVGDIDRISVVNLRYMGFWKGVILNESQISYIYNGGDLKRYPYL